MWIYGQGASALIPAWLNQGRSDKIRHLHPEKDAVGNDNKHTVYLVKLPCKQWLLCFAIKRKGDYCIWLFQKVKLSLLRHTQKLMKMIWNVKNCYLKEILNKTMRQFNPTLRLTMVPWFFIVNHGWPWLTMVDSVLTMMVDHGLLLGSDYNTLTTLVENINLNLSHARVLSVSLVALGMNFQCKKSIFRFTSWYQMLIQRKMEYHVQLWS